MPAPTVVRREEVLPLRDAHDVMRARRRVRDLSTELSFSLVAQTKLVTATSELSRNCIVYGGGGEMIVQQVAGDRGTGLRLGFRDNGPGIPDQDLALTDGWTSGGGLGLGLPGARRLMHEFELDTAVGAGTTVTITLWMS